MRVETACCREELVESVQMELVRENLSYDLKED